MILYEVCTVNTSRFGSLSTAEYCVTLGNSLFPFPVLSIYCNFKKSEKLATFLARIQYNLKCSLYMFSVETINIVIFMKHFLSRNLLVMNI